MIITGIWFHLCFGFGVSFILHDPCLLTSYSVFNTTSREIINLCQVMRYVNL